MGRIKALVAFARRRGLWRQIEMLLTASRLEQTRLRAMKSDTKWSARFGCQASLDQARPDASQSDRIESESESESRSEWQCQCQCQSEAEPIRFEAGAVADANGSGWSWAAFRASLGALPAGLPLGAASRHARPGLGSGFAEPSAVRMLSPTCWRRFCEATVRTPQGIWRRLEATGASAPASTSAPAGEQLVAGAGDSDRGEGSCTGAATATTTTTGGPLGEFTFRLRPGKGREGTRESPRAAGRRTVFQEGSAGRREFKV